METIAIDSLLSMSVVRMSPPVMLLTVESMTESTAKLESSVVTTEHIASTIYFEEQ